MNERVRSHLRLESLYDRITFFIDQSDARDHHCALELLFDIVDVVARADIKSDLLQELERQRAVIEGLRHNPAVAARTLEAVLHEIESTATVLHASAGKFGQHIRESDWLSNIRQRISIPGGACDFDLPSYHHWLQGSADARREELRAWLEPMLPMLRGVRIVLRLLRESADPQEFVARRGVFQQTPVGRVAQMLRIRLPDGLQCVPELSANKYALNIRFLTLAREVRPQVFERDVEFGLTYCNL